MRPSVLRNLTAVALVLVAAAAACRRREEAVPRIAPAEVTPAPRTARTIERLHPASARIGKAFNRQPDGHSALAITGTGFENGDAVFWNGKQLETTYGDPTLLTALIPADLLRKPGEVAVTIKNPTNPASVEVQQTFRLLPP